MEVKINKGIRDYTESMFLGLSLKEFIFFCPCLWCGGGGVFSASLTVWNGNTQLDLYLGVMGEPIKQKK